MTYCDNIFDNFSKQNLKVNTSKFHIDILCAQIVKNPDWFDVILASNLFGDILSDLGPVCTGGMGVAPSANLNSEGKFPSMFEPVHGSAPDLYGKNIANPLATIWSCVMMLEHLVLCNDVGAFGRKRSCSSFIRLYRKDNRIE